MGHAMLLLSCIDRFGPLGIHIERIKTYIYIYIDVYVYIYTYIYKQIYANVCEELQIIYMYINIHIQLSRNFCA